MDLTGKIVAVLDAKSGRSSKTGILNHIFQDDNGRDLRDLLHVSILKCHGKIQNRRSYIKKILKGEYIW